MCNINGSDCNVEVNLGEDSKSGFRQTRGGDQDEGHVQTTDLSAPGTTPRTSGSVKERNHQKASSNLQVGGPEPKAEPGLRTTST